MEMLFLGVSGDTVVLREDVSYMPERFHVDGLRSDSSSCLSNCQHSPKLRFEHSSSVLKLARRF